MTLKKHIRLWYKGAIRSKQVWLGTAMAILGSASELIQPLHDAFDKEAWAWILTVAGILSLIFRVKTTQSLYEMGAQADAKKAQQ